MLFVVGMLCVVLGTVGIVVPGLPTTVFFIAAAACFTRSSPKMEAWILDLPGIGQMVRDHRAGLGMPKRAKVAAVSSIVVFAGLALVLALSAPLARATVGAVAVIGVVYVLRLPTRT